MDQSNDDLQNAINGIVNAGGANAAAPVTGAPADATSTGATDMPDLGVPPMPPVPEAGASLDMALPGVQPEAVPEAPVPEPGADLMNQAPASIEEQAAAEAAPEIAPTPETPVSEPTIESVSEPVGGVTPETPNELSSVRQSMIQDLIPLMDKVTLGADKKFGLYKEVIDSTHDKSMVPAAYEVVKGIEDDTARAEALSYLLNESE